MGDTASGSELLEIDLRLFSELAEDVRDGAFAAFRRLYEEAFPLPDEQQDAGTWLEPPEADKPRSLLVLAGTGLDDAGTVDVWGGLVAEYYPKSRCALLAYLVVDEAKRRRGLARRLLDEAVARLVEEAEKEGERLRAVFGEAEDFRLEAIREKTDFAAERLVIQDRLGARWIDVPYVMPRLDADKKRDPNLLLMAFPHPTVTLNATTVPYAAVEDFLAEYYALEQHNPQDPRQSDDLAAMGDALRTLSRENHAAHEPDRPWEEIPRAERHVPLKALPRPG